MDLEKDITKEKKKSGKGALIVILILLIAALLTLAGLRILRPMLESENSNGQSVTLEINEEEETVYAVNTTPVVLGPIADYFETNGEIISASSVDVFADTSGILARLYVELGDFVRVNQVLAEIDPSRPGLSFALSPVKARISGTITSLPLDRGDVVGPQTAVATIGDLSRLQVVTSIPERFISRIRIGMPGEISLPALPGQVIPLKIDQINPVVDPSSRTLEITLNIPTNQRNVKAGMYAEIRLTTDEKDEVVKIPADAILRRVGETFVYVIENDLARKRNVVPGITLGDVTEILEGLEADEKVVYQGQSLLEDAVRVRVVREIRVID